MVRRRTFCAQLALLIAVGAGGCATMPAEESPAALRDHLMALEVASWEHVRAKAVAPMRSYLADDAILIFGDGARFTKAEFLAIMPDFNLASFTVDPAASVMRIAPDVAVLLYRVTYTSAMKNERPATITVASSSTYARRDGRWVSLLYQETPVR
ncbi:MAG: nuclear transport factor 2 family protein [Alphaproteobacteria bacterium]